MSINFNLSPLFVLNQFLKIYEILLKQKTVICIKYPLLCKMKSIILHVLFQSFYSNSVELFILFYLCLCYPSSSLTLLYPLAAFPYSIPFHVGMICCVLLLFTLSPSHSVLFPHGCGLIQVNNQHIPSSPILPIPERGDAIVLLSNSHEDDFFWI